MPKKKQEKASPFIVPFPDSWESRTRIDLTFNLGSAIPFHRETTVPGIGGLRFVRQASWSVAGIQLAKSTENKKRYRAHEIANAIEALGSKIHFVVNCKCNKEKYKYLGAETDESLANYSSLCCHYPFAVFDASFPSQSIASECIRNNRKFRFR